MVMAVKLNKAHINLQTHPLSMNIYRISERPKKLISRPSGNLQPVSPAPHHFGPECPLKPCWIRLSRNNRFVQDHLQNEVGNIFPHSPNPRSAQAAVCPFHVELSVVLRDSPVLHVTNEHILLSQEVF